MYYIYMYVPTDLERYDKLALLFSCKVDAAKLPWGDGEVVINTHCEW